jgi:predicted carbohydrate-binding protein with CBM5 and CBM33 domain
MKQLFDNYFAFAAIIALFHHHVNGHGYVYSPESRSYLCRIRKNDNCGPIIWEPQSVEGPKDFPESGPIDGHLPSGGGRFKELDEFGVNRWTVPYVQFKSYNETDAIIHFDWRITVPHSTSTFRVFLTNPDYRIGLPLTRKSLFLLPICEENLHGKRPPYPNYRQTCIVSKHLLGFNVGEPRAFYAVWDIADNINAFYQVIDFKTKFPLFIEEDEKTKKKKKPMEDDATVVSGAIGTTASNVYIINQTDLYRLIKLLKKIVTPFIPLFFI